MSPHSLPNTTITPALIEYVDSGAKNLAKFTSPQSLISVNGCTITVNGTVSSTGSRWLWEGQVDNGTYAFAVNYKSGDITTSLYNVTDDINVKSFTGTSGVEFVNLVSGKTYKIGMYMSTGSTITGQEDIMICEKSLWDVSQKFVPYRPSYDETVEQVAENENNILNIISYINSTKNLFTNTATSGSDDTLSWIVNSDKTITLTGTTPTNNYRIEVGTFTFESGKKYILSGCPENGSSSTYRLTGDNSYGDHVYDFGEGSSIITGDGTEYTICIYVNNINTDMTGKIYKPMICTEAAWNVSHEYAPNV